MGGQRPVDWSACLSEFALSDRLTRLRSQLANPTAAADDASLIWAAVAVVIAPGPDSILLIRRAERIGDPWSGHMALPGGRRQAGDGDLLTTAVRETAEEVGIQLGREDLAGCMDDVVPRTPVLPPIAVRPYLFILSAQPDLRLNAEVASAHWVALDHFLRADTHHPVRIEVAGQSRVVPAYELSDGIVWGMTERILNNLVSRL